jgi:NosR/NirI family nitrous oxide reductase transcriptional regulator
MTAPRWRQHVRRIGLHALRALLLVVILGLIHAQHRRELASRQTLPLSDIGVAQLRRFYPTASNVGEAAAIPGSRSVVDADGNSLGYVLQTSPEGDQHIGFSGPTNALLAFDADNRLRGFAILSSRDTREHVAQVRSDARFMHALDGRTWQEAARPSDVDAVSGATLTSLALLEAIGQRLGGEQPSLRFPEPIAIDEAQRLFPTAKVVVRDEQHGALWRVSTDDGKAIGTILRTSPAADNIVGYQGPTEAMIGFSSAGKVIGISLRKSYDNEEYVTYVREDKYFLTLFNDLMLSDLATLDLQQHGVEGVSGATMSSMAVAQGLVAAAKRQASAQSTSLAPARRWINWTLRDAGTAAVIALGVAIGLTNLRANKHLRVGFQILLIAYLGLINGDMLSQAMLVGWAQSGIPWRSAGSLLLLTAAALAIPLVTRRNIYCSHLCPHGAAQQLLRHRLPWQLHPSPAVAKWLKALPGALLTWCVIVAMLHLPFSLVDIEPFDAWVWRVAGWATISIAVVGLVASLFIPMAYCRFGCPTGAMLDFLRFNAHSDRLSRRDWLATLLVLLAVALWAL